MCVYGRKFHYHDIIKLAGSYQCRVGWASANQREPSFVFKNLIAKPRKERGKKVRLVQGSENLSFLLFSAEVLKFVFELIFNHSVVLFSYFPH
jgi:actin-related protein